MSDTGPIRLVCHFGRGNFCTVQANDSMAIGYEFLYSDEKVD